LNMSLRKTIIVKGSMDCNLRCRYCYEFRLHGDKFSCKKLSLDIIVKIIKKCATLFPGSEILWLLHGGEPLLNGITFFDAIAQTVREVNTIHGVHYRIALQTNGSLLSDQWVNAFNRNVDVFGERIISVSIDGPEDVEGSVRVNTAGKSVHGEIMSAIQKIRESNLDFTTITVVGRHNTHEPDKIYQFIQSLNPNFAKFIPCYNMDEWGNMELFGITPLEYAAFMCRIFDLWLADLPNKTDERFVIDPILSIVSKLTGTPVTWCEYRTEKCDNFASLYPNGEFWLCDAYDHGAMSDEAFIGNIFSLDDAALKQAFLLPGDVCAYRDFYHTIMAECLNCEVYQYCCGGCLEKRHSIKMKSEQRYAEFCEGKKILIRHIKNAVDHALS